MSVLPRWNDGFSSDPFLDPAYSITSGSSGWTYNGTTDRLENTTVGSVTASATLLSSNNSTGFVEADLGYYYTNSNDSSISLRAFGYNFIVGETSTGAGAHKYVVVTEETVDPSTLISSTALQNQSSFFIRQPYRIQGDFTLKIVSTPVGVDFYIDSLLLTTQPFKSAAANVRVLFSKSSGTSAGTIHFTRLLVKSDSSLPKTPTLLTPGLSGALTTVSGPIVADVPDSRLYVDLGSYAGRIGSGGLTNVFYDPGGANVAMSEDSGVPDGSGGTTGDYYLESPVRGVSSDNRLVIKESFVTANSVVATDDIDFDVVGGPAGQNGVIVAEDDLQCYVEKYSSNSGNADSSKVIYPKASNISLHNSNADSNDAFVLNGPRSNVIDDNVSFSLGSQFVKFSSSATLPIIFDFDLGKIRHLKGLRWGFLPTDGSSGKNPFSCDVYSHTDPFSGPGLGQGTLNSAGYAGLFTASPAETNAIDEIAAQFNLQDFNPSLNIKTRYLRMVFNTANFTSSGSDYLIAREFFFIESESINSINSVDNNAQFEFDSGGGYAAFPGAGVAQGSGTVRVTLPSSVQHDGVGYTNYYKIYFKPDITD